MKKKNLIILASTAAVALSAGVFGLTRVANGVFSAKAVNETGTFTLNATTNNVWTEDWKQYDITSNRNTTGAVKLCTWYTASFSKKTGTFASLHVGEGDDQAIILLLVKGVTSISWEFDKDVNFTIYFMNYVGGFNTGEFDYTTKTGTWNMTDATYPRDDAIEAYIEFNSEDNYGEFDLDIISLTVTYDVANCAAIPNE